MYNILRALREAGAVRSFEANGSMWFETNTELHGNMVCRVCGRIFDVPPLGEEVQNALITSEHSIESVSIIMNGVCRECRSRMPPP
ncbi:transcriptional repressor [Thermogymnomonas acidicola]|uniref:Fur family transcriptional regulator n=1 Tax=Thermogymnomonas acidicola TaxID=399579 RepID=UPI001494E4D7|nr:transcriptional repressor [Thermogymnomonas acidicola]